MGWFEDGWGGLRMGGVEEWVGWFEDGWGGLGRVGLDG